MAKNKWNKKELDGFRKVILDKRLQVIRDIADSKERADEMLNSNMSNATYSSHMADAGSDQQEREKAFYWLSRENSLLQYMNRALQMIDEGIFGICESCGNKIKKERLIEVPHTTKCFNCKSNAS